MFDDSVGDVISTMDCLWRGVTDPNHLTLIADPNVIIVNDGELTGLATGDCLDSSGLDLGQTVLKSIADATEELDRSMTVLDVPVETAESIDDLRVTLKLRMGLSLEFMGVGVDSGKAYVDVVKTGADSIYLVNKKVDLEPSPLGDEFAVSLIDSTYQVDEIRDLVLHSVATGDEVIIDARSHDADDETVVKYYKASDCTWALDDDELAIALDVRMVRRAMDVIIKLDSSVAGGTDSVGGSLSRGLFNSMLDMGDTWPMVSQTVTGCGLEPEYRLIGLGDFLTIDDVEAAQAELEDDAGLDDVYDDIDGDADDGYDDVEVTAVMPVDGDELTVLNRSNNDALVAVEEFCYQTYSVVATSDEAAEWRVDPTAVKPESVHGVPVSMRVKALEERLSTTLDCTCTVGYLGRRVDDGRLVYARADGEGNLLGYWGED